MKVAVADGGPGRGADGARPFDHQVDRLHVAPGFGPLDEHGFALGIEAQGHQPVARGGQRHGPPQPRRRHLVGLGRRPEQSQAAAGVHDGQVFLPGGELANREQTFALLAAGAGRDQQVEVGPVAGQAEFVGRGTAAAALEHHRSEGNGNTYPQQDMDHAEGSARKDRGILSRHFSRFRQTRRRARPPRPPSPIIETIPPPCNAAVGT